VHKSFWEEEDTYKVDRLFDILPLPPSRMFHRAADHSIPPCLKGSLTSGD
jgi:hypothetical protein